jgi:hypothetical protein
MGLPFVTPLLSIAMTCLLAQSAHGVRRRTLLDTDGNVRALFPCTLYIHARAPVSTKS